MGIVMAATLTSIAVFDKKVNRAFYALLIALWLVHNFQEPLSKLF